jgi:hypothetical protein
MAATAQSLVTPPKIDPIESWLARRGACPQHDVNQLNPEVQRVRRAPPDEPRTEPRRTPFCANSKEDRRAATNRANSLHSTGPRTESGKQRSSQNALGHGLTARTAVLPTEDAEAYQRHIQQFLDEYKPATATETQLTQELADTAWRLNRIPLLEAELLSKDPNPQSLIPKLATLGLHGSRLSRQFQKALDQLREIQEERLRIERRQLTEAAEIFLRHQHKGLPWQPVDDGFVFSTEQIECQARKLVHQNPAFYATLRNFQAAPPPTGA